MYLFVISCIMRISAMCHEYFCNHVSWVFLQCVMSISAMCYEYFCSVSWVILQCVMSISTMCHQYFCNVSWVFFAICHEYFLQYVMNISAMCHEYFCNVSWIFLQCVMCISLVIDYECEVINDHVIRQYRCPRITPSR